MAGGDAEVAAQLQRELNGLDRRRAGVERFAPTSSSGSTTPRPRRARAGKPKEKLDPSVEAAKRQLATTTTSSSSAASTGALPAVGDAVDDAVFAGFAAYVEPSHAQETVRHYVRGVRLVLRDGCALGLQHGARLDSPETQATLKGVKSGTYLAGVRRFVQYFADGAPPAPVGGTQQAAAAKPRRALPRQPVPRSRTAPLDDADLRRLGKFERRRAGCTEWEPYEALLAERSGSLAGLFPVAHVAKDSRSKLWLFAQPGETIRGKLPWPPTLCAAAAAKGFQLPDPVDGEFYVTLGVLPPAMLSKIAELRENLPWERHSLTAFAKPGMASALTPAPKRRALLLACGRDQDQEEFTYQPHRSGGLSGRPNLSMTTTGCSSLGKHGDTANSLMDTLCKHNAELGFVQKGLACVRSFPASETTESGLQVRNIGEGLLYAGGEELGWHHVRTNLALPLQTRCR